MEHREIVQKAFAQQARTFENGGTNLTSTEYLRWMIHSLPLGPDLRVLDVASGTGLLARAIAPHVKEVIALDATPEMQQVAQKTIQDEGRTNIVLHRGHAEKLPYADNTFDMVVSRLAIHHFAVPELPVSEMARVCKPRHVVVVIDLLSPAIDHLIEPYNELERLRDPSHTHALTRDEMVSLLSENGLQVYFEDHRDIEVDLERWFSTTNPDGQVKTHIRSKLAQELRDGTETGMRPFARDSRLMFFQTWSIFVAEK